MEKKMKTLPHHPKRNAARSHSSQLRKLFFKNLFYLSFILILIAGLLPVVSVGAQPVQQTTNLALNKPVTCSANPQFPCAEAVDGNTATRWASAQGIDPQFIY